MSGDKQKLAKQGFMMVVDLTACRVPEDPTFRIPAKGYVVYERGFGTPSYPVPLLVVTALCSGAAQPDPLGSPTQSDLHDSV
jgi:hypothetical protein